MSWDKSWTGRFAQFLIFSPKIKIYIKKKKIEEFNIDYNAKDNSFYNWGGIQCAFDEIKNVSKDWKKNIEKESQLKAENIDSIEISILPPVLPLAFEYKGYKGKLALSLLYKSLIELISNDNIEKYIKDLYNKYSQFEEINNLLNSIKDITNI